MSATKRRWVRSVAFLGALVVSVCGCNRDTGASGGDRESSDLEADVDRPDEPDEEDECDQCAAPTRHLGEMMAEIGRRLERSGRSVAANRWELAAYDIEELGEVFEGELAVFESPPGALDVGKVAAAFARDRLPTLRAAIDAKDRPAFELAYAQTTEGCNSCHRAANHPFIEVPSVLGEPIPRLSPVQNLPSPATTPATAEAP